MSTRLTPESYPPDDHDLSAPAKRPTPTGRKRARTAVALVLLIAFAGGWAQEGPSAAELKRMYDDVVAQLKGAQTRKNELAAENEKLTARIADLEKRTKALETRAATLEVQAVDVADRTWQLRSTNAAIRAFIARDPALKARWDRFLLGNPGPLETPGFEIQLNGPQSWMVPNPLLSGNL